MMIRSDGWNPPVFASRCSSPSAHPGADRRRGGDLVGESSERDLERDDVAMRLDSLTANRSSCASLTALSASSRVSAIGAISLAAGERRRSAVRSTIAAYDIGVRDGRHVRMRRTRNCAPPT